MERTKSLKYIAWLVFYICLQACCEEGSEAVSEFYIESDYLPPLNSLLEGFFWRSEAIGTATMGLEIKLVKRLRRIEPRKVGLAVLAGCFLISLSFLSTPRPFTIPFSDLNFWSSMQAKPTSLMINQLGARSKNVMQERKPMCDVSDPRSDLCEMGGDIRILGNSSTIILVTSSQMGGSENKESWRIRPYARKGDHFAFKYVREVSVKSSADYGEAPRCTVNHNIPVIVFSSGGYSGNLFHGFTDVLIPLFLTSHRYFGEVQFMVSDMKLWWVHKFQPILKQLSRYEVIDFGKDVGVHCFPNAVVGLRSHKEMTIDPSRSPIGYSMVNFTQLVRKSYSLERETAIRIAENPEKKPRLMIISRKRTRSFINITETVRMAEELGYEVVVAEADVGSNLTQFSHVVNSCDVLMGVHGAGLTNLVFLPMNAILIQVIPWGGMEWLGRLDFGEPASDMKLKYLEYKISEDESSLIEQYPRDHPVFKDPLSIHKQGWNALSSTYLDNQNVKLDVRRFRAVLLEALMLLHE